MSYYLLVLLAGMAGSMHCIGMCGGFACALGRDARGRAATLARHLVYNLGRLTSYCFLGAAVGYLGLLLVAHGGDESWASLMQRALAVLSGLLMLYIGLQFLGLLPHRTASLSGFEWLAGGLRGLLARPGPAAPLALGVLNGLLPCPLVYAFVAHAAASGGPLPGLSIMAAFGLGTLPAMLFMGGIGLWLRQRPALSVPVVLGPGPPAAGQARVAANWRLQAVRIAGGFIVLLGCLTLARGVLPAGAHVHDLPFGPAVCEPRR